MHRLLLLCQEDGGDPSRQAREQGEMEGALGNQDCHLKEGRAGALPGPSKMTSVVSPGCTGQ